MRASDPIYTATDREIDLASDWHAGQSSMLYAVASTGHLSRGTIRPNWTGMVPMTDAEWSWHIASNLAAEVQEVAEFSSAVAADKRVARDMLAKLRAVLDYWTSEIEADETDTYNREEK